MHRDSLRIPLGSIDEMPSPRASPRLDTGGDTVYSGVMRETAFKGVISRITTLEELLGTVMHKHDERLKSMESNIDFLVGVVRQNSHNDAFKLLPDTNSQDDDSSSRGWCACWPRFNFL